MTVGWLAAGGLAAFLVGSIPFGFLLGKVRGIDVRRAGSGNIGATNVGRLLGRGWGALVLALDILKGVAGVVGAEWVAGRLAGGALDAIGWRGILFGIAAVLGHNFCPWLGWKGGKGIATTGGVLLVVFPEAFGWAFGAWVVTFAVLRIVSLASLAAAVALATSGMVLYGPGALGWACVVLGVLAVIRHRANIGRLVRGEEPRAFQKKEATPDKEEEVRT